MWPYSSCGHWGQFNVHKFEINLSFLPTGRTSQYEWPLNRGIVKGRIHCKQLQIGCIHCDQKQNAYNVIKFNKCRKSMLNLISKPPHWTSLWTKLPFWTSWLNWVTSFLTPSLNICTKTSYWTSPSFLTSSLQSTTPPYWTSRVK